LHPYELDRAAAFFRGDKRKIVLFENFWGRRYLVHKRSIYMDLCLNPNRNEEETPETITIDVTRLIILGVGGQIDHGY